MASQECREPGAVWQDVLQSRPPLPIDQADVAAIIDGADPNVEAPGWAWVRVARGLTDMRGTFKEPGENPQAHLDLGSSVPIYVQLMRGLEFRRSGERTTQVAAQLFSNEAIETLENEQLKRLHKMTARHQESRELLGASLQAVLYWLTPADVDPQNWDVTSEWLQRNLATQSTIYRRKEGSGGDIELSWGGAIQL